MSAAGAPDVWPLVQTLLVPVLVEDMETAQADETKRLSSEVKSDESLESTTNANRNIF